MLENIYALLEALTRQQHSLVTSLDAKEVRRSSPPHAPCPLLPTLGFESDGCPVLRVCTRLLHASTDVGSNRTGGTVQALLKPWKGVAHGTQSCQWCKA